MNIDYQKIGLRIGQRRRELGLNQEELSEKLNVTSNYLSSIETGAGHASFEMFIKICTTLKVTPNYLLLGCMSSDVETNITDNLKLCTPDDQKLLSEIAELLTQRGKN